MRPLVQELNVGPLSVVVVPQCIDRNPVVVF